MSNGTTKHMAKSVASYGVGNFLMKLQEPDQGRVGFRFSLAFDPPQSNTAGVQLKCLCVVTCSWSIRSFRLCNSMCWSNDVISVIIFTHQEGLVRVGGNGMERIASGYLQNYGDLR